MKNKNIKKLLTLMTIGMMVLPMTACNKMVNIGKQYEEAEEAEKEGKNDKEENEASTEAVNTAQEIHLPVDDDADKKWSYEIEDDSIVQITEEMQLEPGQKTPSEQDAIDVGEAEDKKSDDTGAQVYVVEAVGEGETSITFTYEEGEKNTDNYSYSDKVVLDCSVDKNGNLTTQLKTGMIDEEMSVYMYDGYDELKEAAGIDVLDIDAEGYTKKDFFFNQAVTSITYDGDETVKNTYTIYTNLMNIGIEGGFATSLTTKDIDGVSVEIAEEEDKVIAKWALTNLYYCVYGAGENFDNFESFLEDAVKKSKTLSQDVSGSPVTINREATEETVTSKENSESDTESSTETTEMNSETGD